jgi:two-component system sensor histidine kinase/response regulator
MGLTINPSDYKILVVDDNEFNVHLMDILLTKEKYQIIKAFSGKEALEKVRSENPDLILLDIMMPDMNGYEVMAELKADEKYKELPILLLTAVSSPDDIVKGFKLGASDYVTKPFSKEELLIRINHQVALIAAKNEIVKKNEELQKMLDKLDSSKKN